METRGRRPSHPFMHSYLVAAIGGRQFFLLAVVVPGHVQEERDTNPHASQLHVKQATPDTPHFVPKHNFKGRDEPGDGFHEGHSHVCKESGRGQWAGSGEGKKELDGLQPYLEFGVDEFPIDAMLKLMYRPSCVTRGVVDERVVWTDPRPNTWAEERELTNVAVEQILDSAVAVGVAIGVRAVVFAVLGVWKEEG